MERIMKIGFDLDGTLTRKWEAQWIIGATEMLESFSDAGWEIVIATNQGGIACRAAGWGTHYPSEEEIIERLKALENSLNGIEIEWRVSIYYPDAVEEGELLELIAKSIEELAQQAGLSLECYPGPEARKPGPAMLEGSSLFVGDRESDAEAARKAGIPFVLC
jgi:histidinol phosphatase-like enzyme